MATRFAPYYIKGTLIRPNTFRRLEDLVRDLIRQGKLPDGGAEELCALVLQCRIELLGEHHEEPYNAQALFQSIYSRQDRIEEGAELSGRMSEVTKRLQRERTRGTFSDFPSILKQFWVDWNLWREAEILQRRILAICREIEGKESNGTVKHEANLAAIQRLRERHVFSGCSLAIPWLVGGLLGCYSNAILEAIKSDLIFWRRILG